MAFTVKYTFNGIKVNNAYIKVIRIFGSKKEGWNALVGVFANQKAAEEGAEPIEQFNVNAPFNEENLNAYELVYEAIKEKFPDAVKK